MSENPQCINKDIGVEEQTIFLDAINLIPSSGIGFRGDPLVRAKILQQGIDEPQINYIVFVPPEIRPKVWGRDAESLYHNLNRAINMVLLYSDPWYETGARSRILDPDFESYTDFFKSHKNILPTLTWFTEAKEGQFENVMISGRTWADYELTHHAGNISSFGEIPSENVKPSIVLDETDIEVAQRNLISNLNKSGEKFDSNALRGRREEFR